LGLVGNLPVFLLISNIVHDQVASMQRGEPQQGCGAPSVVSAAAGLPPRGLGLNTAAAHSAEAGAGAKCAGVASAGLLPSLPLPPARRLPAGASASPFSAAVSLGLPVLLVVAASAVVVRLDISQLAPLALLALAYVVLQEWTRSRNRRSKAGSGSCHSQACESSAGGRAASKSPTLEPRDRAGSPSSFEGGQFRLSSSGSRSDQKQDSKVPVVAPSFIAPDFDGQVAELLEQITPTPVSDRAAQKLADCARKAIQMVFPEVEVTGIASGDVVRGTAFGVAVPELDIVATASPHVLIQHLQARLTKGGLSMAKLDARKLQKSAIRVCTDQLVSVGGFKFRRSAFRGAEPKVTLMAPAALGGFDKSIPVDFSVNCVTPLYNAAVVTECGQIDARAKSLILIVRRWAKDRGICHAAKGHLPPYAWTLLAVYFLQVGFDDAPLLPPLRGYKMVNNRMVVQRGGADDDGRHGHSRWEPPGDRSSEASLSVGELFRAFVRFYAEAIDFQTEPISIRQGRRSTAPPAATSSASASSVSPPLAAGVAISSAAVPDVAVGQADASWPSIEDPFEPARNLGTSVSPVGLSRLREELARAHDILQRQRSLSDLLEPWAPSQDRDEEPEGGDDGDEPGLLSAEQRGKVSAQPQQHRRQQPRVAPTSVSAAEPARLVARP